MGEQAVALAKAVQYQSAGTVANAAVEGVAASPNGGVIWSPGHTADLLVAYLGSPREESMQRIVGLVMMCAVAWAAHATDLNWSEPVFDGRLQTAGGKGGIPHVEIRLPDGTWRIVGSRQESLPGRKRVVAVSSDDGGASWVDLATIVEDGTDHLDLGDGTMFYDTVSQPPVLLYVYRRHVVPPSGAQRYYSIRVSASLDHGATWFHHSIVHEIRPPSSRVTTGLWTPSLFRTLGPTGMLQCVFDDGDRPDALTPPGNVNQGQWSYVRRWDEAQKAWIPRSLAAQSPDGRISAEAARTVLRLGTPGHLWSPVESSVGQAPHRALAIRFTESWNSGASWSLTRTADAGWTDIGQEAGPFLHAKPPEVPGYPGLHYDWSWPLAVRLPVTPLSHDGMVVVVFRSDEDLPPHEAPSVTGGGGGNTTTVDKKLFSLFSEDLALTWHKARVSHDLILDHGVVALHDGSVLIGYSAKGYVPRRYVVRRGTLSR
ncbi:MAG: hypothetical protein HY856_09050 [Burkholderiales bacterium]|nr:hypothetical protein [Burkholderiales bacterium]